ncbi:MAG: FecR domain-containing protein [Burkholderiales bacterium]|nr:FecR domain-containing protein [Burkholderiales bacterium]
MLFSWKNPLKALPALLLLAAYAGAAFGAAGNVQFVIGDVKLVTKAGETRALNKGDEVNEGDRIVTAASSSAQIKMVDGGFIAIRPNTDMGFDTYRYSGKEDGQESAVVSLLRGGFRTITGFIGRTNKQNYLIKTATATIGIRGTDHEPMVILAPAPGQTSVAEPGSYDKVNVGVAFIRNDAGSIDIQPNQVGFAPVTRAAPVILPKIPPFYKPTPEPGTQKAKEESKEGGQQETAAAAPGEQAAEATGEIRDTAVVDPASATATAPAASPIPVSPTASAPVVALTATGAAGATLDLTGSTVTPPDGSTIPVVDVPTVVVTNFSSTAVLRNEVLWDTTQIAPGVDPAVTTYIVSDKTSSNLFNNATGTPDTPLTTPSTTPVTLTGSTVNTNFLFDTSGNLIGVLDTPHVVFDHANDVPGSRTQFAIPTPLAHARLSFSGGTAAESYFDPATSIRFGRWSGGAVNVTDLSTGTSYVESLLAPDGAARSLQWVVAQIPSSLPLTGVFQYTRIGDAAGAPSFATAPTDSYGNVGTLDGARLSADFTNSKASAAVRITMPSGPAGSLGIQNLSARFDNAPISNGGFNVSSGASNNPAGTDNLHIGCFGSGCAPDIATGVSAYGGRIRGGFDSATGNAGTADGAFFRYTFNTNYGVNAVTPPAGRVVDDYINGLVAFKLGPEIVLPTSASYPVAAPVAPVTVVATYSYFDAINSFNQSSSGNFWTDRPQTSLVTDAAGNLVSITEPGDSSVFGDNRALALSGGTATPATPTALAIGSTATATDGSILLGWQSPSPTLTVSGVDFNGCFGTTGCVDPVPRTVLGDGLSWVRGPAPFPIYLPGAIAGYTNSTGVVVPGTATYNLGTSVLHDQNGAIGTVNSAGLTVNFGNASVNFDMQATTPAGNWVVSAPGIRLDQEGSFHANAGNSGATIASGTTVQPTSSHDNMNITLTGSTGTFGTMEGQLMGIGAGGAGVTYNLNGFLPCTSGPCPTETASGALAFSLNGTPYSTLTPYHLALNVPGMTLLGELEPSENTRIDGGFLSAYRTQFVNNLPVRMDGQLPVLVVNGPPCTTNCSFVNDIPVVYAVAGATGAASVGTATVLEAGYDPATGMRWGRYGNGTIGVTDRISGASLGVVAATQSVPFVISGSQSGPTVLPITGTFNYTFAGGTSPVDSNGNVGAALTAANASLTANFTAQTVNATLSNLTVGGNTWGASATGIPISANVFQAGKKLGDTIGSMTVTTSLGANPADTSGSLVGGFTGQTGNGVGMAYSLNHGGNTSSNPAAVTASGVVVFKR